MKCNLALGQGSSTNRKCKEKILHSQNTERPRTPQSNNYACPSPAHSPPPLANLRFPCSFYSATEIACLLNISIWNKDWARKRKKLIPLTPRNSRDNFDTNFQTASSRYADYAERCVCWPSCSINVI